jgi:hypothetical protein
MTIQYYQYLQPTGSLSIVTIPGGADIYIDGIKQSDKTPAIIDIPIGQHIYRLTYFGYIDEEGMVPIQEGQTYDLFVTMQESVVIKDVLLYGFLASFAAGITLYLLTRRSNIEG